MITKTVSIIILTYNSDKHIRRCLDRLCAQTFKDFEVILVDAGSVDSTVEIVSTFTGSLDIKFFTAPKTSMGEARNVGIKHSTGRYLAFCDSDDEYLSSKLEAQVGFASTISDERFVVFSNHYNVDLEWSGKAFIGRDNSEFMSHNLTDVLQWQGCNLSSMLIKNDKVNAIYFTEGEGGRYGEDWQYNISLVDNYYNFYHCYGVHSIVNVHNESHTTLAMQYLLVYHVLVKILSVKMALFPFVHSKPAGWLLILPHFLKFIIAFSFCDNKKKYLDCLRELDNRMKVPLKVMHYVLRPFLNKVLFYNLLKFKRLLYRKSDLKI